MRTAERKCSHKTFYVNCDNSRLDNHKIVRERLRRQVDKFVGQIGSQLINITEAMKNNYNVLEVTVWFWCDEDEQV